MSCSMLAPGRAEDAAAVALARASPLGPSEMSFAALRSGYSGVPARPAALGTLDPAIIFVAQV